MNEIVASDDAEAVRMQDEVLQNNIDYDDSSEHSMDNFFLILYFKVLQTVVMRLI